MQGLQLAEAGALSHCEPGMDAETLLLLPMALPSAPSVCMPKPPLLRQGHPGPFSSAELELCQLQTTLGQPHPGHGNPDLYVQLLSPHPFSLEEHLTAGNEAISLFSWAEKEAVKSARS